MENDEMKYPDNLKCFNKNDLFNKNGMNKKNIKSNTESK